MTTELLQNLYDPALPPEDLSPRPQSVDISLTGRCNLRCQYCFYSDEMIALSDLTTDRWLTFFKELGELAVQRVILGGGEVFTRPDIFELIDGIIVNKMRYSILTNGTLINENIISSLKTGKRSLRLDSIQVSIDGSCAAVHNKSRPPDSFDHAIRGLRLLKQAGIPVTVRVTINHHNVNDLENIAAFLLVELGLPDFSTNEVEQMGTARCHGQDVILTEEERLQAYTTLATLNNRYNNRINANAGPLAMGRDFADIEQRIAQGETGITGRGTLSSCGGVFTKMAILHDGTMVPCNLLPSLTMGVVGMNPLQEVWRHHPSINIIRNRSRIPLSSLPECCDCKYTDFCAGGCPASSMAKYEELNRTDPKFCFRLYQQQREAQ